MKEAVLSRRVDLIKLISEKQRELNILGEVLHDIDNEKKDNVIPKLQVECTDRQLEICDICTDAILSGEYGKIMEFFSQDMRIMLPENALRLATEKGIRPLGKYKGMLSKFRDETKPNIVIQPLRFEKCIFKLKYVFYGNVLYGFWIDYE